MSAFILLRSIRKKSSAPAKMSTSVVMITSFDCKSYLFQRRPLCLTSSQTRKPMPPKMMSSIIVMLTSASSEYDTREENGSLTPMRSKPALQKAETE